MIAIREMGVVVATLTVVAALPTCATLIDLWPIIPDPEGVQFE